MDLISLRSFAKELSKIAEIKDPDIRALLAARKGKEYLQGGQIESNDPAETNFVPKIAGMTYTNTVMNMPAKIKDDTPYQTARDWGWRGVQGAATGAGLSRLWHDMHGKVMKPGNYRNAAAIGAGVAIGDRVWRHRHELKQQLQHEKEAMVGSQTFSPARALESSTETGKFVNKIHKGGSRVAGLLGKTGRLPAM